MEEPLGNKDPFTQSSTSNDSPSRGNFADCVSKLEEENLCTFQFELNTEVETSKKEIVLESAVP